MIILGIDPGTAAIGYGLLEKDSDNRIRCLGHGLIETNANRPFPQRLAIISKEIRKLLNKHQPRLLVIESVFFFKNLKTFIPVSRATGVIILEAAKKNIEIKEFTPLQVKMRIAGYGRAEKTDVQKQIKKILKIKSCPKPDDVADALGVALCGALYSAVDKNL